MMQGKSLLNPYAAPFIPRPKNLPGLSFERDDKATKKIVGISDNKEDVGMAGSFQLRGSASVQNVQPIQKFHLSDKLSSNVDQSCFTDEENEMMNDLDSLINMFPDYSTESLFDLLNANQGDLRETIDALEQLEELPETSEIRNNLVPACLKSDLTHSRNST